MIDPQGDLVEHLRTDADLEDVIATFSLPGLTGRAVFRSEAPEAFRAGTLPYIIVDAAQEGPRSLGSFSSRSPMIDVPVRVFAPMSDDGDADLSAAAFAVRRLILQERLTLVGATLNDVDCGFPEETPTSGPSIGGRRLVVRMLITEAAG